MSNRCAFSGSVRAEETKDLSLLDAKGQIKNSFAVSEILSQISQFYEWGTILYTPLLLGSFHTPLFGGELSSN